jgi:acetoin utilization deacetylase AcuC-like enzyme
MNSSLISYSLPVLQKVAVLLHESATRHSNGYGHPESPKRIAALSAAINNQLAVYCSVLPLEVGRKVKPEIVHSKEYVAYLDSLVIAKNTLVSLDEDTYIGSQSIQIAKEGLSLQEQAIDSAIANNNAAFVISRPPGHHARPEGAMGFCIYANAAYAARYAQQAHGIKRIAIVDWDVHHGNGTEKIFYEDSSVFTISLHAHPHWPHGLGEPEHCGKGEGVGYALNLPLPFEAGDAQVVSHFENYLMPRLEKFNPELIIIAAGFDAHRDERNSNTGEKSCLALTEAGYSYMTHRLSSFAKKHCMGRLMLTLEGGYYLPSLVSSFSAVVETIAKERMVQQGNFSNGAAMDEQAFMELVGRIETSQSYSSGDSVSMEKE